MLKYLIIQLCDTSPSFCHYQNNKTDRCLISVDNLHAAILFAMKENLSVQVIWPDYEVPDDLKNELKAIDHSNIVPLSLTSDAEISMVDCVEDLKKASDGSTVVVRLSHNALYDNLAEIVLALKRVDRLNIVITDVDRMKMSDFDKYKSSLEALIPVIKKEYQLGHIVQLNVLTDRMLLDSMNNCNAGDESITVAPNGKFYICPGFYFDGSESVGNVTSGIDIKNQQLFRLDHAPICRICDAWQCKRCVWLNKNTTLEVNTPSHEQCVMAHIERNASRKLLSLIREIGTFLPNKEISEIDYIDPFDLITKNDKG